ncbi:hypothetical protein WDU94_006985 [Cyamophila willieti]
MKSETLVFDVFKMVLTSAVYLALSVSVWIFLRLVYTCFMFPKVMRNLERGLGKKIEKMKRDETMRGELEDKIDEEDETEDVNCKKDK